MALASLLAAAVMVWPTSCFFPTPPLTNPLDPLSTSAGTSSSDGQGTGAASGGISVGDFADHQLSDHMTIEAWVLPTVASRTNGRRNVIVSKNDMGPPGGYSLYTTGSELRLDNHTQGWHSVAVEESFFGRWHHVAWTYDAPTSCIYVDGVLRSSESHWTAIGVSPQPLTLGCYATDATGYFGGCLCEVAIWSQVRDAATVARDSGGIDAASAGLVGYWRLDDGAGAAARDSSPLGHSGTLVTTAGAGAPSWTRMPGPAGSGERWVVGFGPVDRPLADLPITIPQADIVLDGDPSDWAGVGITFADPIGDATRSGPSWDVTSLSLAQKDGMLFFLLRFNGPITEYGVDQFEVEELYRIWLNWQGTTWWEVDLQKRCRSETIIHIGSTLLPNDLSNRYVIARSDDGAGIFEGALDPGPFAPSPTFSVSRAGVYGTGGTGWVDTVDSLQGKEFLAIPSGSPVWPLRIPQGTAVIDGDLSDAPWQARPLVRDAVGDQLSADERLDIRDVWVCQDAEYIYFLVRFGGGAIPPEPFMIVGDYGRTPYDIYVDTSLAPDIGPVLRIEASGFNPVTDSRAFANGDAVEISLRRDASTLDESFTSGWFGLYVGTASVDKYDVLYPVKLFP